MQIEAIVTKRRKFSLKNKTKHSRPPSSLQAAQDQVVEDLSLSNWIPQLSQEMYAHNVLGDSIEVTMRLVVQLQFHRRQPTGQADIDKSREVRLPAKHYY